MNKFMVDPILSLDCAVWTVLGNKLAVVRVQRPLREIEQPSLQQLAFLCCDMSHRVQADNLIYLDPPPTSGSHSLEYAVAVVEPTGVLASMCGNGMGCAAAELARLSGQLFIETRFLVASDELTPSGHRVSSACVGWDQWRFSVDLGPPESGIGTFLNFSATSPTPVVELTTRIPAPIPNARSFFTVVGEPHLVCLAQP